MYLMWWQEEGCQCESVRHKSCHYIGGQAYQAHQGGHIVGGYVLGAAPGPHQVEAHEGVGGRGEAGHQEGVVGQQEEGQAEQGEPPEAEGGADLPGCGGGEGAGAGEEGVEQGGQEAS